MKVFTILMLAVAAVYAWDDGDSEHHDGDYEHHELPPTPPPSCFGPFTCEVLPLGEKAGSSATLNYIADFQVSISWGNVITPEQCCTFCASKSTTTFGLFIYNSGDPHDEVQDCRCYSAIQIHSPTVPVQTGCLDGYGYIDLTGPGTIAIYPQI